MFCYDRMNKRAADFGVTKASICRAMGKNPYYLRDAEKNNMELSDSQVNTIAKVLHCAPEYLRGESDNETTVESVSDDQLKFALFGGIENISDEMLNEVRQFADFVKAKNRGKND